MTKVERLTNVFQNYKRIWAEGLLICAIGGVASLIGLFIGLTYLSLFGAILLLGVLIGVFFGLLLGSILSWVVSVIVCLFLSVYLAYFLMGAPEAVFASYFTPIVGGLASWYSSRKKVFLDEQIEAEYYKDSWFSLNK
ncbi:MAG: hypothetical protein R6W73_04360 [Candidatus Saliniplasma sp.]